MSRTVRNRRAPAIASTEVLAVVGVLGIGTAFALSPESIEDGPVICPFRRLTGLPCPGCGMTRSWVYLAHGWWRESFLAHPFGPLVVAVVLALAVFAVRARLRSRPAPSLDRIVKHPVAIAVIVAWLGFSVIRAVLSVVQ